MTWVITKPGPAAKSDTPHPDTVAHVRDLTALLTTLERRAQQPAAYRPAPPTVDLAPPEPAHTPTI